MSDLALRVENLSKLYPSTLLRTSHIGAAKKRHDTLRDQLSAFSDPLADWGKRVFTRPSPLTPDPSDATIWALHDVSFTVKRGEVVGIPSTEFTLSIAEVFRTSIGRNGAGTLACAQCR